MRIPGILILKIRMAMNKGDLALQYEVRSKIRSARNGARGHFDEPVKKTGKVIQKRQLMAIDIATGASVTVGVVVCTVKEVRQ